MDVDQEKIDRRLKGKYLDVQAKDLDDALRIKEGYSDRNKIAITGGSYGGFMTQWAITQTDLFRSAIALVGISDLCL